jgi:hypothetical protein
MQTLTRRQWIASVSALALIVPARGLVHAQPQEEPAMSVSSSFTVDTIPPPVWLDVAAGARELERLALAAASPALRADILHLQRQDVGSLDHWIGHWLPMASAAQLAGGVWSTNPAHMALVARVRDEDLAGKAEAAYRARKREERAARDSRPEVVPETLSLAAD